MKNFFWIIIVLAVIICVGALGYVGFVMWSQGSLVPGGSNRTNTNLLPGGSVSDLGLPSGNLINLPFFLKGKTTWPGFEGQFGVVRVINDKGEVVTDWVPMQAVGDWQTAGSHGFLAQIPAGDRTKYSINATLEFKKENPSGEAERDEVLKQAVQLAGH